jgi:hypothetical protein
MWVGVRNMKPPVIDYVSPPQRAPGAARRMIVWGLVVAGLVGLGLQGCKTESRIDSVTGSSWSRTTGPLGIPLGRRHFVSPLEQRLKRMGVAWVPDWCLLFQVDTSLLGCSRACGRAPEIRMMRGGMKAYVDAATDEEIRAFVRVMQTGTEAEQQAAVEAAGEKALRAMGVR